MGAWARVFFASIMAACSHQGRGDREECAVQPPNPFAIAEGLLISKCIWSYCEDQNAADLIMSSRHFTWLLWNNVGNSTRALGNKTTFKHKHRYCYHSWYLGAGAGCADIAREKGYSQETDAEKAVRMQMQRSLFTARDGHGYQRMQRQRKLYAYLEDASNSSDIAGSYISTAWTKACDSNPVSSVTNRPMSWTKAWSDPITGKFYTADPGAWQAACPVEWKGRSLPAFLPAPRLEADYIKTFQATGCPNPSPATGRWMTKSDDTVFNAMYSSCKRAARKKATDTQVEQCCGSTPCTPTCVLQTFLQVGVSGATGGGVAWNSPVILEEGQLSNPVDRTYTLTNVPTYMLGGWYVGSRTWPKGTGWEWTISYFPPCVLYIWAWSKHDFSAGIHTKLAATGWAEQEAAGFHLSNFDPPSTHRVWSKTFANGSSVRISGLSGRLVAGVVSQEVGVGATGGGVSWNSQVILVEGTFFDIGGEYPYNTYTFRNVPTFMVGGMYVGSSTAGTNGDEWEWKISYVPPCVLYIWAWAAPPEYADQGWGAGFDNFDPPLTATGWAEQTAAWFYLSSTSISWNRVWSKTFATGSSVTISGLSGRFAGGVVFQEVEADSFG